MVKGVIRSLGVNDSLGLVNSSDLARLWTWFRLCAGVTTLLTGLLLGLRWGWLGGAFAGLLSALVVADSFWRLRKPGMSAFSAIALDITVIGIGMISVGITAVGVGAPLIYMMVLPALLLPLRTAWLMMVYAVGWAVITLSGTATLTMPLDASSAIVTAIAYLVFGTLTVVMVIVVAATVDRGTQHAERSARYETALAECAQALLASSGDDRIEQALEELLVATEATYVFLERNVTDAELGFCSQTFAEAEGSGAVAGLGSAELHDDYWDLVPWERMPSSRQALEKGRPYVVKPEELVGPEYDQYASDPYPIKSELNIPVFANDKWEGLIGFSDQTVIRDWSDTDISLLTTAAKMIGAFWEREEDRSEIGRIAKRAEQSARYETALAECAQALLASPGEGRIEHALEAMFIATEATYVFLERNVIDPELGFCSQVVAEAEDPGAIHFDVSGPYWEIVPWERLPTSRQALENGRPIVIIPEELEGPEYDQYAADPHPVQSELEVPIVVDGEWVGLIGFADQAIARHWSDTDISLLTTAGRIIGAFWEREADREHLEELNRAKDAFLASVSHELRTPLTAVVGFGEILRDSTDTISTQERDDLLELMVQEGTELTNMISDLLVAARADLRALDAVSVPVNLRAQASQVLESFERKQVDRIKLIGNSARATGDPERIRQVVRNLVSNALRYGGDAIRIEVLCDATNAKVLVCDDGTAIPEVDRARIFEPYQRAHDAPGLADSLGLGLAISRQLARLMDGDLTYRHHNGESIFELALAAST